MSVSLPASVSLVGRFVRLEPLAEADLPELWRALGKPEVFAGGYGGGAAGLPADQTAFAAFARGYLPGFTQRGSALTFVIRLVDGPADGRLVGASSLADVEPKREAVHLGWTGYDPAVWGTAVNPEAKLLLLGLAFERGFGRVRIQADARNDRSRAAILKLGATFEGIVRRDARRADGSWRDAAVHSVIDEDWPDVRAGLERRLAGFDGPVVPRD